jgi:hypothetical protein
MVSDVEFDHIGLLPTDALYPTMPLSNDLDFQLPVRDHIVMYCDEQITSPFCLSVKVILEFCFVSKGLLMTTVQVAIQYGQIVNICITHIYFRLSATFFSTLFSTIKTGG